MQKYKKYHIRKDNSNNPILCHCNNFFNFPPPRAGCTPQAPLSIELPIITIYKSITYTPPENIKNRTFFATIRAFFR